MEKTGRIIVAGELGTLKDLGRLLEPTDPSKLPLNTIAISECWIGLEGGFHTIITLGSGGYFGGAASGYRQSISQFEYRNTGSQDGVALNWRIIDRYVSTLEPFFVSTWRKITMTTV